MVVQDGPGPSCPALLLPQHQSLNVISSVHEETRATKSFNDWDFAAAGSLGVTRAGRVLLGVVALGAALTLGLFALGLYLAFGGGDEGPPSTDTDSASLPNDAARLAFARQYLDFHSKVEVVAFHIVFHNNGFAPSDANIQIALKTEPAHIGLWTKGLAPTSPVALGACPRLMSQDARLHAESVPTFYGHGRCWRAVYAAEGVICIACQMS